MGLEFSEERNLTHEGGESFISTDESKVKALVVPTNEERTIARDVIRVLEGVMPTFKPPETVW